MIQKVAFVIVVLCLGVMVYGLMFHPVSSDPRQDTPSRAKYRRKLYCGQVLSQCMKGDGALNEFLESQEKKQEAIQERSESKHCTGNCYKPL